MLFGAAALPCSDVIYPVLLPDGALIIPATLLEQTDDGLLVTEIEAPKDEPV